MPFIVKVHAGLSTSSGTWVEPIPGGHEHIFNQGNGFMSQCFGKRQINITKVIHI